MANPMQQFEVKTIGPKIEIGNFDVSFTNSSLFMVIVVGLISIFFILTTQKKSLVPTRLQLLSEMAYEFVAKMISETAGPKARPFFPFIMTLFLFVLFCNMIGMLPYSFTVTSHIIVTFALAFFIFIGVTIILDPFEKGWVNFGIILGILSPFFGAIMTIFVRRLGKTDHPATTALWYNILSAIIFLLVCLTFDIKWPNFNQTLIILTIIGFVSSLQQICLAYSLKFAPASLLAPLRYVSVPIGILVGVFYFREEVSINFFIGTTIIVFCSLILIKNETKNNIEIINIEDTFRRLNN